MGWAKHQEDIVSRWVNGNDGRQEIHKSPAQVATKRTREALREREKEMSRLKELAMSSTRPLPVITVGRNPHPLKH
jgi:hypothetical protein